VTDAEVAALREDLAAAFRITAQMGWSESVGNHFSAAVSADGKQFLEPQVAAFRSIRPNDLMLLDADDPDVMNRPDAPDASAWTIHGTVHRQCPAARVIIHCHPPHATALATLADPRMLRWTTTPRASSIVSRSIRASADCRTRRRKASALLPHWATKTLLIGEPRRDLHRPDCRRGLRGPLFLRERPRRRCSSPMPAASRSMSSPMKWPKDRARLGRLSRHVLRAFRLA